MNNVLVSIITPCYNSSSFISQAIESVLSQTYKNWEMLIIDDCSTDNSSLIIKKYAEKDQRIKYLKTEKASGGPSVPRNIGLKYANGEYISLLDSDDVWLPNKLEDQLTFLEARNYDFVYSDYEKITWDGNRSNRIINVRAVSSYWDTLESCEIPCLTVLIKKESIGNTRFKLISKEDYVFWLEILRKGCKAYNTRKVHALYREMKNSRSSDKYNMLKKHWYILRKIEEVKIVPAVYFIIIYTFKGFVKYLK